MSLQGRPNWASRCRVPGPEWSNARTLPRSTQWAAAVRRAEGATVPVPTVISSTASRCPSPVHDAFELNYAAELQLVQVHPGGQPGAVVGAPVPGEPRIAQSGPGV